MHAYARHAMRGMPMGGHTYERHACEMHAYEMHTHRMHACGIHAQEKARERDTSIAYTFLSQYSYRT